MHDRRVASHADLEQRIVSLLAMGAAHGYAIATHLEGTGSRDVDSRLLYPALHRMQLNGWVRAQWVPTPDVQRDVKYYVLTPAARRRLGAPVADDAALGADVFVGLTLLALMSASTNAAKASCASALVELAVENRAGLPSLTIFDAMRRVVHILGTIGITAQWSKDQQHIGITKMAQTPKTVFAVRVVITEQSLGPASRSTDFVGIGVRSGDHGGVIAISSAAVEDVLRNSDIDIAVLLGAGIAHELGHVLLGSAAHGSRGLMQSPWSEQELDQARRGDLRFTPYEAAQIRQQLESCMADSDTH